MKNKTGFKAFKNEKASIIVLVICAIIFLLAFFRIHSEDILKGSGQFFSIYDEDTAVEYETATVTEVISEELKDDDIIKGAYIGQQELKVHVNTGRYKGEDMVAYNYLGQLYGVRLSEGDGVTLTIKTYGGGEHNATVYEYNMMPVLAFALVFFALIVIIVGGIIGLKSLVGLVFTFACLFTILIPLLVKGAPTIPSTFIICTYIALVSFIILGGIHRKTVCAFLGTVSGTFIAMVFAIALQYFARIDGLRLDVAEPLLQLKMYGAPIRLRGLLVAGIIISSLGAVMDVAMSISSALEEVHAANPSMTRKELFRSGMNIGRDMAGTMTNTLILAFLGSEFALIIFQYAQELSLIRYCSSAFIAIETISSLSASVGLVMSIPLTAFISSTMITGRGSSIL
jgi:uncharacterized membrane protein